MSNTREWLPFEEALNVSLKCAKEKNIRSAKNWYRLHGANSILRDVPTHPCRVYKGVGWVSWGHWLGTNNHNPKVRKYYVNDNFFKVWSGDMAYILGFWFADGNIFKKRFSIGQNSKRKYILEKFLKKMCSNYPIRQDATGNCRFDILSEKIVADIKRLGGKENKSLDVEFPYIPYKYLSDFIRGLWDGDGSIFYDNWLGAYRSVLTSGSKNFINRTHCELKKHIDGLNGSISHDGNIFRLKFCKSDTKKLKSFLYGKNICRCLKLKEKYKIFQMVK